MTDSDTDKSTNVCIHRNYFTSKIFIFQHNNTYNLILAPNKHKFNAYKIGQSLKIYGDRNKQIYRYTKHDNYFPCDETYICVLINFLDIHHVHNNYIYIRI